MSSVQVTVGAVQVHNVYCSTEHDDFLVYEVSVGDEYAYLLYDYDGKPTLHLYVEQDESAPPSKVTFDVSPDFAHIERPEKGTITVVFYRRPTLLNTRLEWVRSTHP